MANLHDANVCPQALDTHLLRLDVLYGLSQEVHYLRRIAVQRSGYGLLGVGHCHALHEAKKFNFDGGT